MQLKLAWRNLWRNKLRTSIVIQEQKISYVN